MKYVPLVLALLFAQPAIADSAVSAEEWQYLQRVNVVSSVNQQLWKAFEDSGGWNADLARYAQQATRLNVRSLRSWKPPARQLFPFHSSLVEVLAQMERFYGALADRNFGQAEQIGARVRSDMLDVESSWAKIQHRYAAPASR